MLKEGLATVMDRAKACARKWHTSFERRNNNKTLWSYIVVVTGRFDNPKSYIVVVTGRFDNPRVTSLSLLGGLTIQELHRCRDWEVGRSKSYIVVVTGRFDGPRITSLS